MIEIKDLNYHIKSQEILKHINLNFEAGKIYAIIGPNGAGKSTLLKHLMRLIEPPMGTVLYLSQDVRQFKIKEYARKVSYVFQENVRDIDFNVYDILVMGRYNHMDLWGDITKEDEVLINQVISDLKLGYLKDRAIRTLSGGEAQKVFIGRALVQNTPLLLLDEPTSMLDIHNSVELIETIKGLKEKHNLTIIMVLHDLNLAFNYCDELVLLKQGEVICKAEPEKLVDMSCLQEVYHNKLRIIKDESRFYIVPAVKGE